MELFWIPPKAAASPALAGCFQVSAPGLPGVLWMAAGRLVAPGEVWQLRARAVELERALIEVAQEARSLEEAEARLRKRFPELGASSFALAMLDPDGGLALRAQGQALLLLGRSAPRPLPEGATLRLPAAEVTGASFFALVEGESARAEALAALLHDTEQWLGAGAVHRLLLGAKTPAPEAALAALRPAPSRATRPTPAPEEPRPASSPVWLPWAVAGGSSVVAALALLVALLGGRAPAAAPADTRPKLLPVVSEEPPAEEPAPVVKAPKPSSPAKPAEEAPREPPPGTPDDEPPSEPSSAPAAPKESPTGTPKEPATPKKPETSTTKKKTTTNKRP